MEKSSKINSKYFLDHSLQQNLVQECLTSLCLQNDNLVCYPQYSFIFDKQQTAHPSQVRLLCGGGSGHEPAHSGFVCTGMLTGAVCGDVFSSPPTSRIIAGIQKVYSDAGVILIVKNYTGDVTNFSIAVEMMKKENKKVDMLIVDDDISLVNLNSNSNTEFNKRRGLAGTVLLYKILGHMAKEGKSFEEIMKTGKEIIPTLYTVGVSISNVIKPYSSIDASDEIPNGDYSIGLGIHGEKGHAVLKMNSVDQVINDMFDKCFNININKGVLDKMKEAVVVINNLGGLTLIEMGVIIKKVIEYFSKSKINVTHIVHGALMTSFDMKGFSLTLCDLSSINSSDLKKTISEAVISKIPSPNWSVISSPLERFKSIGGFVLHDKVKEKVEVKDDNSKTKKILTKIFETIISKEEELNEIDKKVGDGDIGSGAASASRAAKALLPYNNLETTLKSSLHILGEAIGENFGGSSGPFYMSMILRGIDFLKEKESENDVKAFTTALNEGTKMIMTIGKAKPGDRTMIDYLLPMSELLMKCKDINEIKDSFKSNHEKILNDVKGMKSKRGRSSYLEGKEVGFDEPGCVLADLWIGIAIDNL